MHSRVRVGGYAGRTECSLCARRELGGIPASGTTVNANAILVEVVLARDVAKRAHAVAPAVILSRRLNGQPAAAPDLDMRFRGEIRPFLRSSDVGAHIATILALAVAPVVRRLRDFHLAAAPHALVRGRSRRPLQRAAGIMIAIIPVSIFTDRAYGAQTRRTIDIMFFPPYR